MYHKKTSEERDSGSKEIQSKRNDINLDFKKDSNESQSSIKKRKRSSKKYENINCSVCKSLKDLIKINMFRNKNELIKKMKFYYLNSKKNFGMNNIQLIQQIKEKFVSSLKICENCFENILVSDKCVDIIKNLFFNIKKELNNSLSANISNNLNDNEYDNIIQQKNINENEFSQVKNLYTLIDCDEYDECLKNIVNCLKNSVFEISCFVEAFKFYSSRIKNINNILNNVDNNFFFQTYIQTKIRLESIYQLLNQIIIKFRNITNKIIINYLNLSNSSQNNINLKNNFDSFIFNTNLILANLFNFVNNFNICMRIFKCSNNENYNIKKKSIN